MAGNNRKDENTEEVQAKFYTSVCRQCGNLTEAGAVFCRSCGALPETAAAADGTVTKPEVKEKPAAAEDAKKTNTAKKEKKQTPVRTPGTADAKKGFAGTDRTADFDPADIKKTKNAAPFAYLSFIFLFLKAMYPDSEFMKFHIKQGFVLFCFKTVFCFAAYILVQIFQYPDSSQTMTTPGWLTALLWMCAVPIVVMTAAGMINAGQGKASELPYLGKYAEHAGFLD